MKSRGLWALGLATLALMAGPGVAAAQTDGSADAGTPTQAESTSTPSPEPATTPDPSSTDSTDTGSSSVATDGTSTDATTPVAATPDSSASAPADVTSDQPQAEVDTSQNTVTTSSAVAAHFGTAKAKTSSSTCTKAAAKAAAGVGPPCTGGSRTGRGQISKDPANPTVLPPVNGVTVGIYIDTLPNGNEQVHWQIIAGTFGGTNAIDLSVKSAGPSPIVFTCQVTNTATSGECPSPLNPNSGKGHVDFVDICPGNTTAPPVNPPAGGGVAGANGSGGANGNNGNGNGNGSPGRGVAGETSSSSSPAVASVAATAVEGSGELPVTGFTVVWLLLSGVVLLSGGALVRTRGQ